MNSCDPNTPSFGAAVYHARQTFRITGSKAAADRVLCCCLWLVEGDAGGFLGLTDDALEAKAQRMNLSLNLIVECLYAPGAWPTTERKVA